MRYVKFQTIDSETDRAYVAAIVDILARFNIKKCNSRENRIIWTCNMHIQSIDKRILQFLDKSFNVQRQSKTYYDMKDNPEGWDMRNGRHEVFLWSASGEFLDYILAISIPYLRFNRDKVLLVQDFRRTFNGLGCHPVAPETHELRDKIMWQFRKLLRPIITRGVINRPS